VGAGGSPGIGKNRYHTRATIFAAERHVGEPDDAAAARAANRAQKEFSSIYPQAAVEIQMLCEATTEAELPPLWKILANAKKKEAVIAVSQLLTERTHRSS
jgi:hypothetical protein